jgi:hypothetical protein
MESAGIAGSLGASAAKAVARRRRGRRCFILF